MMTAPREMFERIDQELIRGFVEREEQETLHLEFKTPSNDRSPNRDDRKNFAKAVSGFGNSDGGIIVWGIEARRNRDDVDCATSEKVIQDLARWHGYLQDHSGEAVSPIISGVEHKMIQEEGGATGFLATFVPSSEAPPHMAKLGENRYYKRAGSSFYQMEHFDIADMFGRRSKPVLSIQLAPIPGGNLRGGGTGYDSIHVIVSLCNSGRAVARFPYLALEVSPEPYVIMREGMHRHGGIGLPVRERSDDGPGKHCYAGGADRVIHIGESAEVTLIEGRISTDDCSVPDLRISYTCAADGIPPTAGERVISGLRIARILQDHDPKAIPSVSIRDDDE